MILDALLNVAATVEYDYVAANQLLESSLELCQALELRYASELGQSLLFGYAAFFFFLPKENFNYSHQLNRDIVEPGVPHEVHDVSN